MIQSPLILFSYPQQFFQTKSTSLRLDQRIYLIFLLFMNKIFILLRNQTGHDFSLYKPNTIRRRNERRMTVQQIDAIDFYLKYLQQNLFYNLLYYLILYGKNIKSI